MKRITLACSVTAAIFGALALFGVEDAKIGFIVFFILAVAFTVVLLLRRPSSEMPQEQETG